MTPLPRPGTQAPTSGITLSTDPVLAVWTSLHVVRTRRRFKTVKHSVAAKSIIRGQRPGTVAACCGEEVAHFSPDTMYYVG